MGANDEGAPQPAKVDSGLDGLPLVMSYVIVIIAGVVAGVIYTQTDPNPLVVNVEGFSVFAPLYIAAQAIERFLEPFAAVVSPTTKEKAAMKKAQQKKARALVVEAHPADQMLRPMDEEIQTKEALLAKKKANRAIMLWAIASALGLIICAVLGLGLIAAVAKERPSSEFIRTVDVLLTGLAVGAGTKPLHDLIARIEKAKDNADSAVSAST